MTTALHSSSPQRPVPGEAADPFVFHGRPLRPGVALEDTSRFSDEVWNLAPAMLKKHEARSILDFSHVPARYRQVARELCYAMLSGPVPSGETLPAVRTIRTNFVEYVRFLRWADCRSPHLGALTGPDLEDFQRFLIASLSSSNARTIARAGVRKFWLWRKTLPSGALRFDPRHVDGWGEPHAQSASENTTARIPEEVLGPLFVWALRFVDEFSTDILTADREWRIAGRAVGEHQTRGQLPVSLKNLLADHIADRRPLPGRRGKPSITAIAKVLGGTSRSAVRRYQGLIDEAASAAGITPEPVSDRPIVGRLDSQPWVEAILADHTEQDSLAVLARLLQSACYLILSFLSGARDSEIKHLKHGGLTIERDADGVPYRWKMHSLAFKAESDPGGVPAVWNIGEPAARAILVLDKLQPPDAEFLFARLEHSPGRKPNAANQALTSTATNVQLNDLVTWINNYCDRYGRSDRIPLVDGQPWRLANSQYRRTLAWFIARRPGGVIAGALAYRHHGIQVFEGYAGTSESGFRAEVESEQALARGEHLLATIDANEHTSLTGPAADEAARRLEEFGDRARFQGKVVLDHNRLRRIITKHDPAVYPGEYVTCVHDHTKALCEKARSRRSEGLPDHGGCKPLACRNVALTPANTAAWRREIDCIDRQLASGSLPPLLRHRLESRRTEIEAFLDKNTQAEPT